MHFMVLLSCHNIHVVVPVVITIQSDKQAHIIFAAHCETNYEMKQNERKQNKGIKTVVFKSSRKRNMPAGVV